MTAPRLRPTFTLPLALPREEAIETLRALFVAMPDLSGRWRGMGRWAELYVPSEERRIWSPYLSIRLDEADEGCELFGRFAPHPEVWTFFVFLYGLVAFLALFGAIFGYVQWASSEPAWGLWAVWIGVPVLLLLHVASWLGQRWGQEQMARLRGELDEALEGAPDLTP